MIKVVLFLMLIVFECDIFSSMVSVVKEGRFYSLQYPKCVSDKNLSKKTRAYIDSMNDYVKSLDSDEMCKGSSGSAQSIECASQSKKKKDRKSRKQLSISKQKIADKISDSDNEDEVLIETNNNVLDAELVLARQALDGFNSYLKSTVLLTILDNEKILQKECSELVLLNIMSNLHEMADKIDKCELLISKLFEDVTAKTDEANEFILSQLRVLLVPYRGIFLSANSMIGLIDAQLKVVSRKISREGI